ncbi:MAG TPA: hypothetical protein VMR76_01455 [Candidatus Saccharimonadia bacterium]|nr:hypothetical protein [Candidatus Saccharimonadia bacterium]
MSRIVFFNCFHNGDIHVSRGLVRQVINKVKQIDPGTTFSYSHRNPANLLADIPDLQFDPHAIGAVRNEHENLQRHGDIIFFNTWYAQQHHKYMNRYGITFDSLYAAFDDTCKNLWGFSLDSISPDPSIFFPIIDYSKFEIDHATHWLQTNINKKILIENGEALSGQATNFDMTSIIANIAKHHMDKIFIFTSHSNTRLPDNCIYSDGIIKKQTRSDLNEISLLSAQCDMVIGRASGVFSFTLTQDNLFRRNMKYLCFSNLVPTKDNKFWLSSLLQDKINYTSHIITTNESNIHNISSLIESHL